jgi:DNA polymerase I
VDERPFPNARAIGLDLETTGLEFWNPSHELVLITLSDGEDVIVRGNTNFRASHVYDRIIICHNTAFDLPWMDVTFNTDFPEQVWDTLIAEQLINAGLDVPNDLASATQRRLGIELSKELQTSFDGGQLSDEQIEYAKQDAKVLVPLARAQHKIIQENGLSDVWEIERMATPVFAKMNRYGVRIDRDRLEALVNKAKQEMERLECVLSDALSPHVQPMRQAKYEAECAELDQWLSGLETAEEQGKDAERTYRDTYKRPKRPELDISPINLNSQQQVKAALKDVGVELKSTAKGEIEYAIVRDDIDADVKEAILKPFREYRKQSKRVQAFGDKLLGRIQPDGRLYSDITQIGTKTGRPTSSKPDLLNMPNDKAFRSVFLPDEGHLMIVIDYSQMELRILAELSQDPAMMQLFIDGKDLHTETARNVYRVKTPTDKQRKGAKRVSLGVPYGTSAVGIQLQLQEDGIDMPRHECQMIIDEWKEKLFPVAWRRLSAWQRQALEQGYTETAFGRRRNFPKPKTGREIGAVKRAGGNFPMQGTNADITKLAMAMVDRALSPVGGRVVLNVYDELVCSAPEEHAEWAAKVVTHSMEEAAKAVLKTVPVEVDCTISSSWAEIEAEAVTL